MSKVPEVITSKFITAVNDRGYLPWQKPWEYRPQMNAVTGNVYHGINQLMALAHSDSCPYWASYKQLQRSGHKLLDGAAGNGIAIVYVGSSSKTDFEFTDSGVESVEKAFKFMRYYTVFNLKLTTMPIPEEEQTEQLLVNLSLDSLLTNPKLPTIEFGGSRAYYSRGNDKLVIPYISQYGSEIEFYSTLFHELIHSTMHSSRLNREVEISNKTEYSFEELVAEMGAAILASRTGLYDEASWNNSVSYVQSWLQKLSDNPTWLTSAASKAEKAADYIIKETKLCAD